MKAIKNFDENVYVVQDESGKYYIKVNGKIFNMDEVLYLINDINKAYEYIAEKE